MLHLAILERLLLVTAIFYDFFEYPLTASELHRWMITSGAQEYSLAEILETLKHSPSLQKHLQTKDGFYFLPGRHALIGVRNERYRFAERKFRRATWITSFLGALPFVQMVAVVNTLAFSNTRDESDIDILIVAKKGTLALVRMLTVMVLESFDLRPKKENMTDTVCASFFISDDALSLEAVAIAPREGVGDLYLASWIARAFPLYDRGGVHQRFRAANEWAGNGLFRATPSLHGVRRTVFLPFAVRAAKAVVESVFFLLVRLSDPLLIKIQRAILPHPLAQLANKDTRVIVTPAMMKFHPNDRREEFQERFIKRIKEIIHY